ncbi:MAG: hypothetical protein WC712_07005 [Candidatus Brocadiia bacterium]
MKYIIFALLLTSVAIGSLASADKLVPALWKGAPTAGTDGARYVALCGDLESAIDLFAKKDPRLTRVCTAAESQCVELIANHSFSSDPEGYVLLSRIRFWMLLFCGRYGEANAVAADMATRTKEPRYLLWSAIASEKGGLAIAGTKELLSDPAVALGVAQFCAMIGKPERAAEISLAVWNCEPVRSALRREAALTRANALYVLFRDRLALRFLHATFTALPSSDRASFAEQALALPVVKDSEIRRLLWGALRETGSFDQAIAGAKAALAKGDVTAYAQIALAVYDISSSPGFDVSDVINELGHAGTIGLLRSFDDSCRREGEFHSALISAFLECRDFERSAYWLARSFDAAPGTAPVFCRMYAEGCKQAGVQATLNTDGLSPLARAFFALSEGDMPRLELAVREIRAREPDSPFALLAPLAAAVRRGDSIAITLDVLDTLMEKSKPDAEWLANFECSAVARHLVAGTEGDSAKMAALVERMATRICGGVDDPPTTALQFCAIAGSDRRLEGECVARLMTAAFEKNPGTLPMWYADVVCGKLMPLVGKPELIGSVKRLLLTFPKHAELHLVLGRLLLSAGLMQDSRAELETAFALGDTRVRAAVEDVFRTNFPVKEEN